MIDSSPADQMQATTPEQRALRWRLVTAALMAVVSIYVIVSGFGYGQGTLASPGAGAFPVLAGFLGLTSAAVVLLECLTRSGDALEVMERVTWAGVRRMVLYVVAIALFPLLLDRAGYLIAGSLSTALIARLAGQRNPLWCLVVGVALTGATYLGAIHLIGVPLPSGIFGV